MMHADLKALLDVHPLARRLLRHLAYFEGALAKQGQKAAQEVPLEVLATALEQFESLVIDWSKRGLAALRSKMAVALLARSKDPFYGLSQHRLSAFNTESRLQVDDVSHSIFRELVDQYEGLVAPESIQAIVNQSGQARPSSQPDAARQ